MDKVRAFPFTCAQKHVTEGRAEREAWRLTRKRSVRCAIRTVPNGMESLHALVDRKLHRRPQWIRTSSQMLYGSAIVRTHGERTDGCAGGARLYTGCPTLLSRYGLCY